MKFKFLPVYVAVFALILLTGVVSATKARIWEKKIDSASLGGENRFQLYVSTDKPIYRSGESLFLRAVSLNAATNIPKTNGNLYIQVKILGPNKEVVHQTSGHGEESSAGIRWSIPDGMAGGQYVAQVRDLMNGAPQVERKFEIRAYRAPRLKSHIEFLRDGYGPGDEVQASLKVNRATGGVPEGAKVTLVARVDGATIYSQKDLLLSKEGTCTASFQLPEEMKVGEGRLSFIIKDGGVLETKSKTIPILLQNLTIHFYPEGGELVAGLPCRVYAQVFRSDGKPADIEGRIIEVGEKPSGQKTVARLKTTHEGRGLFTFNPESNKGYALVLDKPSKIEKTFKLPQVRDEGATLESLQSVYPFQGAISLRVTSTKNSGASKVTLSKREVEIDAFDISSGEESTVTLNPGDSEGVHMVTVWNAEGHPLAERLIFRKARFQVKLKLEAEGGSFVPGGHVKLNVLTTDKNDQPVEAMVGLTVTDDAVLQMVEKREQAPRLPAMVYLENEVRDLADAHVYLDASLNRSAEALDLLLGTQGWRRFILVQYKAIKNKFKEDAMRAMAEKKPPRPRVVAMRRLMRANAMPEAEEIILEDRAVGMKFREKNIAVIEKKKLDLKVKDEADEEVAGEIAVAGNMLAGKDMDLQQAKRFMREYAHQRHPNRKKGERVDFTETLYFHTGLKTSARDGKASVEFSLSDSITSFRVMADAFGRNGALGTGDLFIQSVEPFYIEPKLPLEMTVGDRVQIPVAMVNASGDDFEKVNILVRGKGIQIEQVKAIRLGAGERGRSLITISAAKPGRYKITFNAAGGAYTDTVIKNLVVKPRGFPVALHHGGLLNHEKSFKTKIIIPKEAEAGSLFTVTKVYPSPLANMEEALNALLRQPNGCFEQTSSTNYPLVMAQQYFRSHQGISPEKIVKAKKLLHAGYKKLVGFECRKKGYEWFGSDPGHEALTAYGLMEFVDMSKVMSVDEQMISRTRNWLLSRRDGEGGFKKNKKALDSFGRAPKPTTNAYILWALLESGEDPKNLQKEIEVVKTKAMTSKDSYVMALAANIVHLAGDLPAYATLATRLSENVEKDGSLSGAVTSITRSGGVGLKIETTSLAILAWLKNDDRWAAQVENAMLWLFETCKGGRFGSTQSTILALKAINAYDQARAKPKAPGQVQLLLDGRPFGEAVSFDESSKGAIELPDFAVALTPGEHTLELQMKDGSKMPFAVEVKYNTSLPLSSTDASIKLKSQLSQSKVNEGAPLELKVEVEAGEQDVPTPVAILGLPAGVEVRHDHLKELVGADRISSYEVRGREVVLYWRAMKANEKRNLSLQLTANIPGKTTAPASRIYAYYEDENKQWEGGHTIEVLAK